VGTQRERAAAYAEASIKTWRSTLHLVLADAVDEGLRESNPAAGDEVNVLGVHRNVVQRRR
jgi:hypothetical protein